MKEINQLGDLSSMYRTASVGAAHAALAPAYCVLISTRRDNFVLRVCLCLTIPTMSQTAGPSTPSPRRTAPRRSLNPYASDAPSASPHRGSVPAASPLRRVVVAASEDGTPSKRRRVEGAAESSHQNRPSVTQQEQAQGDRTDVALDALKARRQSRGSVGSASRSSVGGRRKSRGSTGGTVDTSRYNDRVDALNKAVDKFLELIDEAAT